MSHTRPLCSLNNIRMLLIPRLIIIRVRKNKEQCKNKEQFLHTLEHFLQ